MVHPQPPLGQAPAAPVTEGSPSITACRFCGSVPAVETTFRGHQGFLVVMRFLSVPGPFCRDCGLATFRTMTSRTLVQGWYGFLSLFVTPLTVAVNLLRRRRVASLPAPQPNPYGPSRPPMDPGLGLLQRPMTIIGLAIPFAVVLLITIMSLTH